MLIVPNGNAGHLHKNPQLAHACRVCLNSIVLGTRGAHQLRLQP